MIHLLGAFLNSTQMLEGLAICGCSLSTVGLEVLLNGIFTNPSEELKLALDLSSNRMVRMGERVVGESVQTKQINETVVSLSPQTRAG